MGNHITNKCVWYEVCGVFEREWTDDVPLSFRIAKLEFVCTQYDV